MGRQRIVWYPSRGRIVNALPAPVRVVPSVVSLRRPLALPIRRGHIFTPVLGVKQGAPPVLIGRRALRVAASRGRVFNRPAPPKVITAGPLVTNLIRRHLWVPKRYSGKEFNPPYRLPIVGSNGPLVPNTIRRHRWEPHKFRGAMFSPHMVGLAPVAPTIIPSFTRAKRPSWKSTRGRIFTPIPRVVNTSPGPVVPNTIRRHRWQLRNWRGLVFMPHQVGQAPAPPPPINPVPPNFTGGLSGLSLGKRMHRNKNRPIKSSYDKTLVFRQLWGDD